MAAVLGRTELGVKEIGRTVTIPNDPKARLMYYLDCMCVVLDLSDTANLSRLRYALINDTIRLINTGVRCAEGT